MRGGNGAGILSGSVPKVETKMADTILGPVEQSFQSCRTGLELVRQVREDYKRRGDTEKANKVECEYSLLFQERRRQFRDIDRISDRTKQETESDDFKVTSGCEDHIHQRSIETRNPVLGMTYNFVLWERARDFEAAKRAIVWARQAWIQSLNLEDWLGMIVAPWRSCTVAAQINLPDEVDESKTLHYRLLDCLEKAENFRWHIELLHSLLWIDKFLNVSDLARMLTYVTTSIKSFEQKPDTVLNILLELDEVEAMIHTAKNDPASARSVRERAAGRLFNKGVQKKSAGEPAVAIPFLEDAFTEYADLGGFPEKLGEIKTLIQECVQIARAQSEAKQISIPIDTRKIEVWLESIRKMPLLEILVQISRNPVFLPSLQRASVVSPTLLYIWRLWT
jgi:hypothetical protein